MYRRMYGRRWGGWRRRYWRGRGGCCCCPIVLLGLALGAAGTVTLIAMAATSLIH